MSPNGAAKRASKLLHDSITARQHYWQKDYRSTRPRLCIQLGWEYRTLDHHGRFKTVFDIMGEGENPEMALADLVQNMRMDDKMAFPEYDPSVDGEWRFLAEMYRSGKHPYYRQRNF